MRPAFLLLALTLAAAPAAAQPVSLKTPPAVIADPTPDTAFPARLEVLHIPSGGVKINGIALVAAGPGPHPVFVLFHGLPGNEKNLDLAQAVRRAGWTVVTINYRGSWGSPGEFRFGQNLEDARATLAYVRDPAVARTLRIDPARMVVAGHSMGGWVTAHTAAAEPGLLGAVTFSAADVAMRGVQGRDNPRAVAAAMDGNREALAGVTGESMAAELIAHGEDWRLDRLGPQLKDLPMLVLHSDDGFRPDSERMIAAVKAAGGTGIQEAHVATDHGWSDHRIALESLVINWLDGLGAK
ncbi:MAG TPA: alpha/beta fold hydrolase [Phenylobacterium sp.]|nr:alpha/beta fold hydrolase [Phenylobacterium sp.]